MTHPYTDPINSGLVQLTPSQRLMNADAYRSRRGPGMLAAGGSHGSPLGGLSGSLGEVLDAAGHGRSGSPVTSDADEPKQGVVSDGDDLYHVRGNDDGSSTAMHLGPDGLGAAQEDG